MFVADEPPVSGDLAIRPPRHDVARGWPRTSISALWWLTDHEAGNLPGWRLLSSLERPIESSLWVASKILDILLDSAFQTNTIASRFAVRRDLCFSLL